jgi:hypothetical protein
MRAEAVPAEPWRSFLQEPDGLLKGPVELRCLGGLVVTQQYGIGRKYPMSILSPSLRSHRMMMSKRLPGWDRNLLHV